MNKLFLVGKSLSNLVYIPILVKN